MPLALKKIVSARLSWVAGCVCLATPLLQGNPPPTEWQIITPVGAGAVTGGLYFPLQNAFDGAPTWDGGAAVVGGTGGANSAPGYNDRYGYIDFGPDYDEVHIMETWTRYRSYSGGSHPGYVEMWWDDDIDAANDDGVSEDRLNFNNGQGVPNVGSEIWFRDKRINELGGVIPQRRYLIIKSSSTYADRAREYAIVGFIYDGLVPPAYANLPQLTLSNDELEENGPWEELVGTLSLSGGEPGEIYTVQFDNTIGDNRYFRLDGTDLWGTRSFDYESQAGYNLEFDVVDSGGGVTDIQLEVRILDRTGKWDANGVADAEVAAAYPEVNEGDFIIWSATDSSGPHIYYNSGIELTTPNKLLIKAGIYDSISLNLADVNGTNADNRVPITNFLGQVYANSFALRNGQYWRLTGQYDAANGLGHADFPGCDTAVSSVDFGFSHQRFGIWVSKEWENESGSMVYVNGQAYGWEIDHIEVSDGGFAGMLLKQDSGSFDMNEVYLHHLYIHDTGSEGIYLGSTQGDPQHMFHDLTVENCLIVRTGTEALQLGQLGANCLIRNNVLWGALDWMSPFQRYQDNTVQVGTRQGGVTFSGNVLLGAAGNFYNVSNAPRGDITPNGDPFVFENNVHWASRSGSGGYQFANTDGVTPWIWRNNFFGGFEFTYDLVIPSSWNTGSIHLIPTASVDVTVENTVYDATRSSAYLRWASGTANIIASNNVQKTVLPPAFRDFLGLGAREDFLRWNRWSATIGEDSGFPSNGTNKGDPITYAVGDIVQHFHNGQTRFYRCLQEHTLQEPPADGNAYWELLTWTNGEREQYIPPDDARLVPGSIYDQLGMGLGGDDDYDTDVDGLPASWEREHGLNDAIPTAANGPDGNPDGDAFSNWDEFLAGTDPMRADLPLALAINMAPGTFQVNWTPPAGRVWKLQSSEDLIEWDDLTSYAQGGAVPVNETGPVSGSRLLIRAVVEEESVLDLLP
ncbi:hypothetical protein [Cerasicoccus fimbriatus]|uniref:hypothetical protein n=1 Tax=Cerasicoccus fimbriatus TaxID=3014554 RepID=UPI0022B47326|nr:hypothetical protein [Cerasicoccus sp. TK19100]